MADLMMKVAARGADGTAKALRADNDGNLNVVLDNRLSVDKETTEKDYLYNNDFSSPPTYNVLSGTFTYDTNEKIVKSTGTTANNLIFLGFTTGDCFIEGKIKSIGAPKYGTIIFGVKDNTNYYYIQPIENTLKKMVNGTATTIATGNFTAPIDYGTTPMYKIQRTGSTINIWINGTLWCSVDDTTFLTGNVGFRGYGDNPALYNLSVYKLATQKALRTVLEGQTETKLVSSKMESLSYTPDSPVPGKTKANMQPRTVDEISFDFNQLIDNVYEQTLALFHNLDVSVDVKIATVITFGDGTANRRSSYLWQGTLPSGSNVLFMPEKSINSTDDDTHYGVELPELRQPLEKIRVYIKPSSPPTTGSVFFKAFRRY